MEFLVSALKANRKAAYADIKAKADEKKLKLFPIMFGRAKLLLGIVKAAKRGTGKFARASAAKRAGGASPAKRGRGRPPGGGASKSGQVRTLLATGMSAADIAAKVGCTTALVYNIKSKGGSAAKRGPGQPRNVAAAGVDGIAGIVAMVQSGERERGKMREALERVQTVIAAALG